MFPALTYRNQDIIINKAYLRLLFFNIYTAFNENKMVYLTVCIYYNLGLFSPNPTQVFYVS